MARFTKKHYEEVAKFLSEIEYYSVTKSWITQGLAKMFKEDNPKFNIKKFLKASNVSMEGKDND